MGGDGVVAGGLAGADDLDEEGYDVEDDEEAGQALRFDAPDRGVGEHEIHDSSQCHVGEGIDPEWGEEDEKLRGKGRGGLVFHGHGDDAGCEAASLPHGTHDQDPTVSLAIEECLRDMGDSDSTKDDGKEDRRTKGWTI